MPVFDNTLMFLSSGNLTAGGATVPSSGLKIRGTPNEGLAARVNVPSTPGTHAKLTIAIHASDDDSTYNIISTYPGGAQSWASGAQEFIVPFATKKKYVKMVFTVATATTGDSFGAAKAGIVPRVFADWSREVDWS